jgi:hypothetical protein
MCRKLNLKLIARLIAKLCFVEESNCFNKRVFSRMAAAANRQSAAIEFIVKPKDDLFLEGALRTLPRVSKGESLFCSYELDDSMVSFIVIRVDIISCEHKLNNHLTSRPHYLIFSGEPYPCQMQKNQTFSCLFRHYAKHNGLKKEGDLSKILYLKNIQFIINSSFVRLHTQILSSSLRMSCFLIRCRRLFTLCHKVGF